MKVEISGTNSKHDFKKVYEGDVTVVYTGDCKISFVSTNCDGSTRIIIDHPCIATYTEQSDYPQKCLWLKPAYQED